MENLKNNKILIALVVITSVNLLFFVFGKILIEKITTNVIEKLQKEYSPSPYGPGFDPDKVDPRIFEKTSEDLLNNYGAVTNHFWRQSWELDRGFSLLQ